MVDHSEFDELLGLIREFVRREVLPAEAGIDESDEIPPRLIAQAKEMGLYGYALPAEYGGLGLSVVQQVRLTIELGYGAPAFRSLFGTNNGIAGQVLVLAGTPAQRKSWLPRLASGEVVASFALTEPDAGSDPSRLVSTAVRDGGEWVIDGLKRYITNAPMADAFLIRGIAVERLYRDVRLFRIYEGTSQIQQLIIAREMLRLSSESWTLPS
jgi:acyl-CoA dehydrogenase